MYFSNKSVSGKNIVKLRIIVKLEIVKSRIHCAYIAPKPPQRHPDQEYIYIYIGLGVYDDLGMKR